MYSYFFFFQAEDGIRDYKVTGVQTCALPILVRISERAPVWEAHPHSGARTDLGPAESVSGGSEDRDGSERRGAFRGVVRLPGFRLHAGKSQLDSSLPRLGRSQADSVRLAAPGGSAERPPVRTRSARVAAIGWLPRIGRRTHRRTLFRGGNRRCAGAHPMGRAMRFRSAAACHAARRRVEEFFRGFRGWRL